MAVREFDGTDDVLTLGAGSLGTLCNGAYSVVWIIAPSLTTSEVTFGILHSGGFLHLAIFSTGGGMRMVNDADDCNVGVMNVDSTWQILGFSKASGTVAPRMHRKQLGAGAWTHTAAGSTGTNRTQAVSSIQIGGANGEFYASKMGTVALFATELSDANFESIQTTPSTQQLADLGAVALWDLNQASTGTAVEDLIGTAEQSALTGTTVVVGDDPTGWTFGLAPPPTTSNEAALRTGKSPLIWRT